MIATIYTLSAKGIIFYVGQTSGTLNKRLSVHLSQTRIGTANKNKSSFIIDNEYDIIIEEVETIDGEKEYILQMETYWAHIFKSWGFPITNGNLFPAPKTEREPNLENVSVHKDLVIKIKDNKKKNGTSIRFFVERAIENEFKRLEQESAA